MSDLAFANKYRPKKMSDLVGQDHIVKILSNAILTDSLHHAYLFGGKFGCGKTSAARLLAACVNNPGGSSLTPDESNPLVQSIFEGKSIDVKEIDAASNRGIEDIRALKESISFAPLESKYKFVIIDEAHRLTDAAAEAALKMIEEPPPNVIFVLCTTDVHKLKETIYSRCQPLRFSKIAWDVIGQQLSKVAKNENLDIDENAIKIAARLSKGSMRNALQNLQMMATLAGKQKITKELAEQALGAMDEGHFFVLVDAILKPDAGEAMRVIDRILSDGRDIGDVLEGLVGHLRVLMLAKTCQSTSGLVYLTEAEKKRYEMQKNSIHLQLVVKMIELVGDINRAINLNMSPQVALETFVVQSIIEGAYLKKSS